MGSRHEFGAPVVQSLVPSHFGAVQIWVQSHRWDIRVWICWHHSHISLDVSLTASHNFVAWVWLNSLNYQTCELSSFTPNYWTHFKKAPDSKLAPNSCLMEAQNPKIYFLRVAALFMRECTPPAAWFVEIFSKQHFDQYIYSGIGLPLVDGHCDLRRHGVVQLFVQPHPVKEVPSQVRPRESSLH